MKKKSNHTQQVHNLKPEPAETRCPAIPEENVHGEHFLVSDTTSEDNTISFKHTFHNLSYHLLSLYYLNDQSTTSTTF